MFAENCFSFLLLDGTQKPLFCCATSLLSASFLAAMIVQQQEGTGCNWQNARATAARARRQLEDAAEILQVFVLI